MRTVISCMLMCVLLSGHAIAADTQQKISLYSTCDANMVDSVWREHVSFRVSVGSWISEGVAVELPFACTLDQSGGGEILLDVSLKLLVYPWSSGPFLAISLTQFALFTGPNIPQESMHYLNEISFGYTWSFSPRWFIRPAIIFRDPSDSAQDSFAYVAGLVPTHTRLKFSLDVGWVFASIIP